MDLGANLAHFATYSDDVGTVYTGHKKRMSSRFSVTAHCNAAGQTAQDRAPRRARPRKRKRAPARRKKAAPKRKRKPAKPRRAKSAKRVAQGKRISATLERDSRGRFLPAGGLRRAFRASGIAPEPTRVRRTRNVTADQSIFGAPGVPVDLVTLDTIKEGLSLAKELAAIFLAGKAFF